MLQKKQAQREEASGVRLVIRLFARPLWLLGLAVQMAGLGCHIYALMKAPVTVVQPIIAAGIAFLVVFARLVLGEVPDRRQLAGMALAGAGLVVLVTAAGGAVKMRQFTHVQLGGAAGGVAFAVGALSRAAGARGGLSAPAAAVAAGLAAGTPQGMSDAMNRLMGAWLWPGDGWAPPAAFGLVGVAGLMGFGSAGLVIAQNALRRFPANTVVPCMITAELIVPIAMATALFGQDFPATPSARAAWIVAFALVVSGIWVLGSSSALAEKFAEAPPGH